MDLWSETMRLHQKVQYYYHTKMSIQNPSNNSQRIMDITFRMLHDYLRIPLIMTAINDRTTQHLENISTYHNLLVNELPNHQVIRRLKRCWPTDLN